MKKIVLVLMSLTMFASASIANSQEVTQESVALKLKESKQLSADVKELQLKINALRFGRNAAATVLVPLSVVSVVVTGLGIKAITVAPGAEERAMGSIVASVGGVATVVVGGITYAVLKLTTKQMNKLQVRLDEIKNQLQAEESALLALQASI